MSDETINQAEISLPRGFHFDEVRARPRVAATPVTVPELGPLADFGVSPTKVRKVPQKSS